MNWLFANKWFQLVIVILVVGAVIWVTGVHFRFSAGIGGSDLINFGFGK